MNRLLEVVFGLDALRPGDEGVRLGMTHDLPLWVWTPVVVLAIALALWSYWRLEGPIRGRVFLACVRGVLLVLLAVLAAGPRLVRENERTERDSVVVLLDRSASMTMPDAGASGTRDAQLRAVASDAVWEQLAEQHDMLWLGFDAAAYELHDGELGEPVGARTRLGAAVEDALARLSGRPISGVVVVTDGRTSDAPDARLLRELTAARVGVYAVPLGSERALLDLALEAADAPTSAFVGDFVPVTARVVARGLAETTPEARVVLIDTITGAELDAKQIEPDAWRDGVAEVRLAARPEDAGNSRWVVRVETPGSDVLTTNNERTVEVELLDRPLRVVYFEGYPRWEYRYMKDLLVRESSVRSSVMLLATDRRYIQEGDVGLAHVPRSSGEWSEFDVVVIGDVRPDVFSQEQLEQLRDHVALRGGGLVWIAGPGSTPWSWASTPLGDLLPFVASVGGGQAGFSAHATPVTLQPEAAATRLGVLEMGEGVGAGWLPALSDASMGWPVLRWSLAVEPEAVKATAEVLASSVPISGSGGVTPCVLTMRYGAGRVVFVGTDEIWRWRYARGEELPERFYLPLMRLAGVCLGAVGRWCSRRCPARSGWTCLCASARSCSINRLWMPRRQRSRCGSRARARPRGPRRRSSSGLRGGAGWTVQRLYAPAAVVGGRRPTRRVGCRASRGSLLWRRWIRCSRRRVRGRRSGLLRLMMRCARPRPITVCLQISPSGRGARLCSRASSSGWRSSCRTVRW